MEEKQKVWIKVPQGKEKEAVDILKKRGGKYALSLDVEDLAGDVLLIDHDGNIVNVDARSEFARMLEDYYTEIMIDDPWKDGNVLVCDKWPGQYAVFKKYRDDGVFEAYFIIDDNGLSINATASVQNYHLANDIEYDTFAKTFYELGRKFFVVINKLER